MRKYVGILAAAGAMMPAAGTAGAQTTSSTSSSSSSTTTTARPALGGDPGSTTGSTSAAGNAFRQGEICSPAGATATAQNGAPIVCTVASDGRLRWLSTGSATTAVSVTATPALTG